jgi:hypothetical protein
MAFAKPTKRPYVSLFKKCTECKFHILRDEGYSNYTVEGTAFNCALGLNPHAPFDNFYSKAPELNFAESCTSFKPGPGLQLDVDGEVLSDLTDDQKTLLELEKTSMLIKQN